jgi:hypothetical protein
MNSNDSKFDNEVLDISDILLKKILAYYIKPNGEIVIDERYHRLYKIIDDAMRNFVYEK